MDLLEKLASRMAKRVETDELSPVGVRLLKRVIDRVVQLTQPTSKPEPVIEVDQLAQDATSYHNWLLHSYWELLPDFMKAITPEPARGDPAMKPRHDEWLESVKGSIQRKPAQPVVDDLYSENKHLWKKKEPSLVIQGIRHEMRNGKIIK